MIWPEAVFAFVVALMISVLLLGPAGWRHPRGQSAIGSGVFLLLTVFLFTWAVGAGVRPFGPRAWNIQWVPFLWLGVIIGLILLAASAAPPRGPAETPPEEERGRSEDAETQEGVVQKEKAAVDPTPSRKYRIVYAISGIFGFFFWTLAAALIIFLVVQAFSARGAFQG